METGVQVPMRYSSIQACRCPLFVTFALLSTAIALPDVALEAIRVARICISCDGVGDGEDARVPESIGQVRGVLHAFGRRAIDAGLQRLGMGHEQSLAELAVPARFGAKRWHAKRRAHRTAGVVRRPKIVLTRKRIRDLVNRRRLPS